MSLVSKWKWSHSGLLTLSCIKTKWGVCLTMHSWVSITRETNLVSLGGTHRSALITDSWVIFMLWSLRPQETSVAQTVSMDTIQLNGYKTFRNNDIQKANNCVASLHSTSVVSGWHWGLELNKTEKAMGPQTLPSTSLHPRWSGCLPSLGT